MVTEGDTVTWEAVHDRESDRVRLLVYHLGAGVVAVIGLLVVSVLVALAARGQVDTDGRTLLLFVVLLLVGGPASLWYLRLASTYGTERERAEILPTVRWLRRRYLPVAAVGGVVLLLPLALQPGVVLAYPLAFVVARWVVDLRYTVGRLGPRTGRLVLAVGTAAVECAETGGLDPGRRSVRSHDLSPLRRVHRLRVGGYTLFVLRYRRRGWWGRPIALVVPAEAADRVGAALETVARTGDWDGGDGLDRSVRVALGGLGAVFLSATGIFAVVAAERLAVVAYAVAVLGLFGAGMLIAAIRG
jgi:hypothetical protein